MLTSSSSNKRQGTITDTSCECLCTFLCTFHVNLLNVYWSKKCEEQQVACRPQSLISYSLTKCKYVFNSYRTDCKTATGFTIHQRSCLQSYFIMKLLSYPVVQVNFSVSACRWPMRCTVLINSFFIPLFFFSCFKWITHSSTGAQPNIPYHAVWYIRAGSLAAMKL